jgi:two-component system OmpR family sensor kinase
MFGNVRWRIALWFVGLSTAAYVIPTGLALWMFYISLTAGIDRELMVFMGSFGHAIKVVNGKPVLRDWARIVETSPAHSLVSYQLFDRDGKLLEAHFPPGIPTLFKTETEVSEGGQTMRTKMTPLTDDGKLVGYLQVQMPTKTRDDAVSSLAFITAIVAPVVLFGLGWSSYLVSEKATVPIRQALEKLRQFIADAGHELYTPLGIVQAANESLSRVAGPAGAVDAEICESALERMEKMLEDLMLLSTMDATGKNQEVVNLAELLDGIVNEFGPKFERKGVLLSLAMASKGSTRGDSIALIRMFSNIIENALRYTEPGGQVNVALAKDAHKLVITVSDTGIGIPKECIPKIFDRFYRVDVSRSRSSGGSGLGLAIALAIAEAHEGSMEVESELGSGSRFSIHLPLTHNDKSFVQNE